MEVVILILVAQRPYLHSSSFDAVQNRIDGQEVKY